MLQWRIDVGWICAERPIGVIWICLLKEYICQLSGGQAPSPLGGIKDVVTTQRKTVLCWVSPLPPWNATPSSDKINFYTFIALPLLWFHLLIVSNGLFFYTTLSLFMCRSHPEQGQVLRPFWYRIILKWVPLLSSVHRHNSISHLAPKTSVKSFADSGGSAKVLELDSVTLKRPSQVMVMVFLKPSPGFKAFDHWKIRHSKGRACPPGMHQNFIHSGIWFLTATSRIVLKDLPAGHGSRISLMSLPFRTSIQSIT